ncbi:MAG: ATPase, T2SS/T4P/T4SS family [Planctomycetota bacterium]
MAVTADARPAGRAMTAPEVTRTAKPASTGPRLGERLVTAGVISPVELEAALREQQTTSGWLGEKLVELGFVDEEKLLPFLAEHIGVRSVRIRDGVVDPAAIPLLPRARAEALEAVALFRIRDELTVAMADPLDLDAVDEIERTTGLTVRAVLALRTSIAKLQSRGYDGDFEVDEVTADLEDSSVEFDEVAERIELGDMMELSEGTPVVNLVNYAIVHAVRQGASDIHFEPGRQKSSIRFRVDGQLREVLQPKRELHQAVVSRIKVMAKMDIAEHRLPQDGRLHVVVEGRSIDLRCSTLPTVLGEKVVLRVLDRESVTFDLNALGVPAGHLTAIRRMIGRPHGLVLVTGPTGSGKTTTLYSAIELLKSVHNNVVTVEDPVEYQLARINQVHANRATGLTFASALRAILRQDPDVIMIGEIRDAETAEVAIQAALTGHLVLSTLHTNDAVGAITRLRDMGVASYKIASAFSGVIAQRLVRQICPDCKTRYYPSAETFDLVGFEGDRRQAFFKGEGCAACYDTGCKGRIGLYETLPGDPDLRELIAADSGEAAIREWHRVSGGTSLLAEGVARAEQAATSLDEVIRVALFD